MGADRRTVTQYIAQLSQLQSAVIAGEDVQDQYNQKVQEFIAIKTLVDLLRNMETEIKYFENFFTSFHYK